MVFVNAKRAVLALLLIAIGGLGLFTAAHSASADVPKPFFYVAPTGPGTAQVAAGFQHNGQVSAVVVNVSSNPEASVSGKVTGGEGGAATHNGNFVISPPPHETEAPSAAEVHPDK